MDAKLQRFWEQIGRNVTAAREFRSMGLNELARRSKVDPGNLSKIEAGKQGAEVRTLLRLAEVLEIHPFQLMLDEEQVRTMKAVAGLAPPASPIQMPTDIKKNLPSQK